MIGFGRNVPLDLGLASQLLPWIVGMQVFLATLALASGVLLFTTGNVWRTNLSGTLTIQVPAGVAQSQNVDAAIELLKMTPGITSAARITDQDVATMLEPWLGAHVFSLDLPMPVLIDTAVRPGEFVDLSDLSSRLERVAPGAVIDNHAVWLGSLVNMVDVGVTVSFIIITIILLVVMTTVFVTTRAGLEVHSDVIEVLHLIGAQDSYIAHQFQFHTFRLSGLGAVGGFVAGAGVILFFQVYGSTFSDNLLPELTLDWLHWAGLALLPISAVLLVCLTVGLTVRRSLGRMM